jgi:hypothetical protein
MADPKDIDEVLLILQADLPVLRKDRDGQVGNQKTKYADLAQANDQILTRLNALGTTWVCKPTLLLPDYRFVLKYRLKHVASGTCEEGEFPIKGDTPMQQGSAITYGRRYALLAVTGVVAEDDDDDGGAASGRQTAQRATQQRAAARGARQEQTAGQTAQRASQRPRGARPPLPGEDPDGPVGQDQHRRMHALWNELGFGGDENRDNRLTITAKIVGLPDLDSSAKLTRAQGDQVIAALVERKAAMVGGEG